MGWIGCVILAGNSQTAPTIFFHIFIIRFFNSLVKNQQTTNAPTFLTRFISAIGDYLKRINKIIRP
jgi:hypothetical protein